MTNMKDSYDFKAKEMARQKVREFHEKHYSENERKNLKVLTMLGHESCELEQIWDPLGVPRENIYVIEGFPRAYEILEQNNAYGTNLLPMQTIDEFVNGDGANMEFGSMNIDYQGYFNLSKLRTLQAMGQNNILGEKGILSTWYSGRQENNETKELYDSANWMKLNLINEFTNEELSNPRLANYFRNKLKNVSSGKFREELSEEVVSSMRNGETNFEISPLIKLLGLEEEYYPFLNQEDSKIERGKNLLTCLQQQIPFPNDPSILRMVEAYKKIRSKVSGFSMADKAKQGINLEDLSEYYLDFHKSWGNDFLHNKIKEALLTDLREYTLIFDQAFFEGLTLAISNESKKGYLHLEGEKYKYHSDKGTPMMVDLNAFSKDIKSPIGWKIKKGKLVVNKDQIRRNPYRAVNRINEKIAALSHPTSDYFSTERVYLSAPKSEQKLKQEIKQEVKTIPFTRENVYQLMAEGKSNEDIVGLMPEVNPRSLPAYRAHITMNEQGIQKGRKKKNSKLEEQVLDSEIKIPVKEVIEEEKPYILTEEEAKDFMRSGISSREIQEAYPESFNIKKLAGLKRSVTVQKNKELVA